jgi:hypothetical protein
MSGYKNCKHLRIKEDIVEKVQDLIFTLKNPEDL